MGGSNVIETPMFATLLLSLIVVVAVAAILTRNRHWWAPVLVLVLLVFVRTLGESPHGAGGPVWLFVLNGPLWWLVVLSLTMLAFVWSLQVSRRQQAADRGRTASPRRETPARVVRWTDAGG